MIWPFRKKTKAERLDALEVRFSDLRARHEAIKGMIDLSNNIPDSVLHEYLDVAQELAEVHHQAEQLRSELRSSAS